MFFFKSFNNREKTPWTKLRKEPRPKKNERRIFVLWCTRKELENKAYPSEFMAATMFFGLHSVDWMFGPLEVATTFLLFRWLVPFPFTVFPKAFLFVFPQIQWAILVADTRGSKAHVSLVGGLTQLTAALMRCDKLSKLYFCFNFLTSSELIGYIDLTD